MAGINDYFLSKNPRTYHFGIDRGFLLSEEEGVSAPWPGLISVESQPTSKDTDSVYIDGERVLSLPPAYDETFLLKAYSYPKSFERFMGVDAPHVSGSDNKPLYKIHDSGTTDKFGFTYRTKTNDDGWVIHIYFDCTAELQPYSSLTVNSNVNLTEYAWKITPNKVNIKDDIYSSHISVDMEMFKGQPGLLGELYRRLYVGLTYQSNKLFNLKEFIDFLDFVYEPTKYRLYMGYNSNTEWTLVGPKNTNYYSDESKSKGIDDYSVPYGSWTAYKINGGVDETTGEFNITGGPLTQE